MNNYKKYIEHRLKEETKLSSQYLSALTAVDCYGAKREFYLLQFEFSECLLFKCITSSNDNPTKIGIVSGKKFKHSLNELFKDTAQAEELRTKYEEAYFVDEGVCRYDPYYDTLSSVLREYNEQIIHALEEIDLKQDIPVFVSCNDGFPVKAIMWALQKKAKKVVMMQKSPERLNTNEPLRVLHLHDFNKMHLNTTPARSIAECFTPLSLFIPLADRTLDSEFYGEKRWRDLLVNIDTTDSCIINGVPCQCVTIEMQVDIFNNVFCRVKIKENLYNTIHLHDAFPVDLPAETREITDTAPIENAAAPISVYYCKE